MYLLPAGAPPRPTTKWNLAGMRGLRGLGILPAMQDREFIAPYAGMINTAARAGYSTPILPATLTTNITATAPKSTMVPAIETPLAWPASPKPIAPIIPVVEKPPTPQPIPVSMPLPTPNTPLFNAGTPVPTGYPTSQLFVANDGSLWQYNSSSGWFNAGTPYGPPGASATPAPAAPVNTGGGGSSTSVAPPVNVTVAPTTDSGYQSILDWLTQQTLINGVPNWGVSVGVAAILWKISSSSQKGGR